MSAEDVVMQIKRKGTFDELRKRLLSDLETAPVGQQFLKSLQDFMEEKIKEDPSLLDKDRSTFHSLMMNDIEKAGMYQSIQNEVVTTLMQAEDFQKRVEEEMLAVLQNL
ncbi:complex proteins associated with Set1p component shg1-domain-containing protein [Cunninghamella echinulata]|nr:complex proteins associated with Set1p component shg1-domain-containing protein [Cunninghamella echinulata]